MKNERIELEKTVLGSLSLSFMSKDKNEFKKTMEYLTETDFDSLTNAVIFKVMKSFYDTGKEFDLIILTQELYGRVQSSYIASLVDNVGSPMLCYSYANILKHQNTERDKKNVLIKGLQDNETTTSELIDDLHAVQKSDRKNEIVNAAAVCNPAYDMIRYNRENGIVPGVLSSYKIIDENTGGFHNGEITIIGARPGVGKSSMMLNIAYNMLMTGKRVGFISLEMTNQQLVLNLISRHTKVDGMRIRKNTLTDDNYFDLMTNKEEIEKFKMFFNGNVSSDVFDVIQTVTTMKHAENVDICFIDYLQLMVAKKARYNNRVNEIEYISRQFVLLAKRLNIPFVIASQLNRAAGEDNNRRPLLVELRSSGAIEQDADNIFFLWRQHFGSQNVNFTIAKQRNGVLQGETELSFVGSEYRYYENE